MITTATAADSVSAKNDINEDKTAIENELAVYDQTVSARTVRWPLQ